MAILQKSFYVPIFTAALALSAFLLFSIQPLFGKMVLPLLGGAPAVWNTVMLFFQAALLAGYAYAHLTSRFLRPGVQAATHLVLLVGAATLTLPIEIPDGWADPSGLENPVPWLLALMTLSVGAPFFVLAATAPMLQRWFAYSGHSHAANPYFLYAASNAGSLAALLSYPFLIEPLIGVASQNRGWTALYIAAALLISFCALLPRESLAAKPETVPANDSRPGNRLRLIWLFLAFVPSSLMLGVTTHISTDIAAVPLIWIVPLALYLLTFVLVFSRFFRPPLPALMHLQGIAVALAVILSLLSINVFMAATLLSHLAAFFFCALCCHALLANLRPGVAHLTEYYLILAAGGALGGVFNSIAAPLLLPLPVEYPLALVLAIAAPFIAGIETFRKDEVINNWHWLITITIALAAIIFFHNVASALLGGTAAMIFCLFRLLKKPVAFAIGLSLAIVAYPGFDWTSIDRLIHVERNFFGVSRVMDSELGGMRLFLHGTTLHGAQPKIESVRLTPISYYSSTGPGGQIFGILSLHLKDRKEQNVAVLGLGTGSVACFAMPGRKFDFYEIDPAVKRIAENRTYFTYLKDCGSPYNVIIGDGRLKIAQAPDKSYDMILLDAFSSDSIPVHLMTREAFAIYWSKLKDDGMIVVNISNRYLNLAPIVAAIANEFGAQIRFGFGMAELIMPPDISSSAAIYAVMSKNENVINIIDKKYFGWKKFNAQPARLWTDDYANIAGALEIPMRRPHLE